MKPVARSEAASHFSLLACVPFQHLQHSPLLLILRIHLNKSILIQLHMCVNNTLRLPLHTFCVTSCFLQAPPLALSIHSCVSLIRVNTSDAANLRLCCCMRGRATPDHLRIPSSCVKGLTSVSRQGLSSRVIFTGHPKLT